MKNFIKRLFIFSALLLAPTYNSQAEDIALDRIVVTPSRIEETSGNVSRKINVITSDDIESSQAEDLPQAIDNITSVDINSYGGLGSTKNLSIRGSSAAQALVMVDGRPINNPRDGNVELSNIPLDNIDRVEVMYGPASSLYGSAAMGGTVNIITKRPPKKGQKTEAYSAFGTYRTYTERLNQGAKIGKFGYLISGGYQSSEGFRANSAFNAKDCNLKFEYGPNDNNNLSLNSGFYTSKVGTPYKITTPDLDDKQKNLKKFFDFNWQFKPAEAIEIATKIYENDDRLEFIENSPTYTKDIHATKARGLNTQYSQRFNNYYQLICGFNYVTNLNNSTASAKHKYIVRAGYLENKFNFFERLEMDIGGRFDDYSNFGSEFSPSFSLLYKFNEDLKLHGMLSRSFRAPTFNDLYWPRTDYYWNGFWVGAEEGNSNLRPEKGIAGEIGTEVKINKYILSNLTYYRSKYTDLISWGEEASVWRPTNISSALIEGIEFENKIFLPFNIEFNMGYTFLKAKDIDTHEYLIYRPKNKVDCSLKYKNPKAGFTFELKGQFVGTRYHDPENAIKVKQYFLIGLNASKKIGENFTYTMSIDNLLNKKYQSVRDFSMPKFSITSGIKAEF
ncbi:MAG: TonB-dependent receptor [Candidatus Omnitrophica bacterium]|nr:TonB-dependent receptor [Candidatus Omnitrophota bacterium]